MKPCTVGARCAPAHEASVCNEFLEMSLLSPDGSPTILLSEAMTEHEDTALIAAQLAELTQTVEEMAAQLRALHDRARTQQERADTHQDRIDIAARELAEVSERIQAAANALRHQI